MRRFALTLALALAAAPLAAQEAVEPAHSAAAPAVAPAGAENDYPTEARADYVFACMQTNGQTREALTRCACSIDQIASILPYDDYVAAETVLMMRQGAGERAAIFRGGAPSVREITANLRRAQAEAEMLCF